MRGAAILAIDTGAEKITNDLLDLVPIDYAAERASARPRHDPGPWTRRPRYESGPAAPAPADRRRPGASRDRRLCLMHPRTREFYIDRERVVREGIAHLRTAWAAHPKDQPLTDLIAEFIARDEEFARLWNEGDVKLNGRGRKAIRHPEVGLPAVNFETLTPLQDSDQLLVIYRAADDESQSALDRLSAVSRNP
ncbi:hypothetical protein ABIA35_006598 [Catenulispora sp. MAP12-49]